jgi:hypothetical protein
MARKGKIARLPLVVRDEVNRHLKNGRPAKKIVDWLNSLPEVQQVTKDEFDGDPINEMNLSNWRHGGYLESQEPPLDPKSVTQILLEASPALVASVQGGLSDRMAVLFAAHMLTDVQAMGAETGPERKVQLWREFRMGLAAMRRYEYYTAKHRAEFGRLAHERSEQANADQPPKLLQDQQTVREALGIPKDGPRWDEEKGSYIGEGAEALNEQRRKIMSGELYADKPVFEDWRKEAPPSNPPEATKAN